MSQWQILKTAPLPKLRDPIFIEGLPGIGNVGKVAIDFIIDGTKARKIFDIYSHVFPHSVFVTENNLIELPKISMYYKKMPKKKRDILLLGGDVQPTDEVPSYEFSEKILDMIEKFNCKEIVTLGGIGLPIVPKKPKVYITGNSKELIEKYVAGTDLDKKLYGVVGPIIGVSGLLLGLSKRRRMRAVSLLAETYGHPMYLGMRGAREAVRILNQKLSLGLNISQLDREIEEVEKETLKRSHGMEVPKSAALKKLQDKFVQGETTYIG